jgi:integrase
VGSGKWLFRYSAGKDPVTGNPIRRSVTIEARTRSAARVKATALLAELNVEIVGTNASLIEVLAEWMKFQEGRGRSPTTLNGYQSLIDTYIVPALGSVKIVDLTAHQLDTLYRHCSTIGRSPRTVRNIHRVISAALNQAVRWGWIERNPALRATLPVAAPIKVVAPSAEEVRQLISACHERDEILGAFVFLAAVTGARRGEIAALRWSSLLGDALVINSSVYKVKGRAGLKSTKSGHERVIHLDAVLQEWFGEWRVRCEQIAAAWAIELVADGFILSSRPDGSQFVHLDGVSHKVRTVATSLGLPSMHLHSLRHFAASELLAAGIPARDAADMLGHSDPALTLRVYSHSSVERQRQASRALVKSLEAS